MGMDRQLKKKKWTTKKKLSLSEGGIVQELNTETGTMVKAGDPLITLTNSSLQLEVLNREAQLYEQINNLRTSRLLLDQNTQNLEKELAEVDYRLQLVTPEYERQKFLYDEQVISRKEYEEAKENFDYNTKRRVIVSSAYQQELKLGLSLLVGLLTIGHRAIKAAMVNPANSLKSD